MYTSRAKTCKCTTYQWYNPPPPPPPPPSLSFLAVEPCGRTRFSRQTGIILSPHYPLAYPPDLSCTFQIDIRPGNMLVLSTEELNIPATGNCHAGDKINVKHFRENDLEPLFVLCGTSLFYPYLY